MPPRPPSTLSPNCQHHTRLALRTIFDLPPPTYSRTNATTIHQIRTKKSKAATTAYQLPVRLLKDVPGFGRAGSIVPVPAGLMRAVLYPQREAIYIKPLERREMRRSGAVVERDVLFQAALLRKKRGARDAALRAAGEGAESPAAMKLGTVAPAKAIEMIEALVPPTLEFVRVAVFEEVRGNAPQVETGEVADGEPEAGKAIYGSVSTADILTSVKAVLAADTEASAAGLVGVLGVDNVRLVNGEGAVEEAVDRIKTLGEFGFVIRVKGHDEVVKRIVQVLAETTA